MTWRPMKVPSKTWDGAARVYERLAPTSPALEAVRRLCEHVARAPYRDLVFCAQSMHALLISQQPEIEWNCCVLRVEVTRDDEISFVLHEQPFVEPATFRCAPQDAISTFEPFLRRAKWVSEAGFSAR